MTRHNVYNRQLVATLNTLDSNKLSKKGEKAIESFEVLNDQFIKLIENRKDLDKTADTITKVAGSIAGLGEALANVDSTKLGNLATISEAELKASIEEQEGFIGRIASSILGNKKPVATQEVETQASSETTNIYNQQSTKEQVKENWDEISVMIGDEVGQQVANAFKAGQFKFEFDTSKTGGIMYWNPQ